MNNTRRRALSKISKELEELKGQIECLLEEEEECKDNLPESLQDSEKGQTMEDSINNMEYARDSLDEVTGYIDEIVC